MVNHNSFNGPFIFEIRRPFILKIRTIPTFKNFSLVMKSLTSMLSSKYSFVSRSIFKFRQLWNILQNWIAGKSEKTFVDILSVKINKLGIGWFWLPGTCFSWSRLRIKNSINHFPAFSMPLLIFYDPWKKLGAGTTSFNFCFSNFQNIH